MRFYCFFVALLMHRFLSRISGMQLAASSGRSLQGSKPVLQLLITTTWPGLVLVLSSRQLIVRAGGLSANRETFTACLCHPRLRVQQTARNQVHPAHAILALKKKTASVLRQISAMASRRSARMCRALSRFGAVNLLSLAQAVFRCRAMNTSPARRVVPGLWVCQSAPRLRRVARHTAAA